MCWVVLITRETLTGNKTLSLSNDDICHSAVIWGWSCLLGLLQCNRKDSKRFFGTNSWSYPALTLFPSSFHKININKHQCTQGVQLLVFPLESTHNLLSCFFFKVWRSPLFSYVGLHFIAYFLDGKTVWLLPHLRIFKKPIAFFEFFTKFVVCLFVGRPEFRSICDFVI